MGKRRTGDFHGKAPVLWVSERLVVLMHGQRQEGQSGPVAMSYALQMGVSSGRRYLLEAVFLWLRLS